MAEEAAAAVDKPATTESDSPASSGRALVVAVGASQCSLRALQWAVDCVARQGDHCHIVHVITCMTPTLEVFHGWGAGTSYRFHDPSAPQHEQADLAAARRFIHAKLRYLLCRDHLALRRSVFPLLDSKALAHDVHLSVETVDAPASAIAQAVAQVAEEVDATLVVLGTNNVLTGEDGPDLGSTARHCLAHFDRPLAFVS